jgi:hypothetical protein
MRRFAGSGGAMNEDEAMVRQPLDHFVDHLLAANRRQT